MIFDFKCQNCKRMETDVFVPFHHDKADHPACCSQRMEKVFLTFPQVHWKDYDLPDGGFKAAHDGTVITTRKQNLDYMKKHGLQDANEVYSVPTFGEERKLREQSQAAIDNITPTNDEMQMLKESGIVDESGNLTEKGTL